MYLYKVGPSTSTIGGPSNTIENAQIRKSEKPNASKPHDKYVRLDRIYHWSIDAKLRNRCKMPVFYKGHTWQECEKCQAALCVGKGKT